MLLQADKDKEKVASIIAKALQHQGGSNENLPDAAGGGVPNISSSTPSSENATLAMHTMPIELSIHFERADKGLGLSIAGMYISIFCILEEEEKLFIFKRSKLANPLFLNWKLQKYIHITAIQTELIIVKSLTKEIFFNHICFLLLKTQTSWFFFTFCFWVRNTK